MRSFLGMWKCECCNLSNSDDCERCFYCDLPRDHTPEDLEKYKQTLPSITGKRKNSNIIKSLLFSTIEHMFKEYPQASLAIILGFMLLIPAIRDMSILLPIGLVVSVLVWGYFYMKK